MTDQDTRPATDRELLRAFAEGRDGEAFAELVRRHGGLVHGVCERVLGADADDAFQATFLVLARKAGSVRRPELLGNWLYGVAVRCARRAQARAAKPHDRKSTRLNSSHLVSSYAVICLQCNSIVHVRPTQTTE